MATRAERAPGGYRLTGNKMWITNSPVADLALVWAKLDDVIRGWIHTTPPEQRNGLVAVIESIGLEPEIYENELQSDEGWEEEPEDSGM